MKIALQAASAKPLPDHASQAGRRSGNLTPREAQVSQLLTEGLTSQEIATRLTISKRTADAHVEHIMTKLGVHSRAQIAASVGRSRAASPAAGS